MLFLRLTEFSSNLEAPSMFEDFFPGFSRTLKLCVSREFTSLLRVCIDQYLMAKKREKLTNSWAKLLKNCGFAVLFLPKWSLLILSSFLTYPKHENHRNCPNSWQYIVSDSSQTDVTSNLGVKFYHFVYTLMRQALTRTKSELKIKNSYLKSDLSVTFW